MATTPKVKMRLTPYELLTLNGMLLELIGRPIPADNSERCVVATLQMWQRKKISPLMDYPQPVNTLTLDAPLALAFLAVFELTEAKPGEALDTKLLALSDSIQKTFISPIS